MPKIYYNGVMCDTAEMTSEELTFFERIINAEAEMPAPEPTPEERIAALEEELKAAKILLGLEV